MSSGDKNVSFRCIIWTKEIFFRQSDTSPFLTKGELFYKNPLKRSVLKSQFQNPQNLDEENWFFHDSRKKTSDSRRNKKWIKYAFIKGTNKIHVFFITNAFFFSSQPQRCLTFSWIELQMLIRCCLIDKHHHTEIILIFTICIELGLFMSCLCDLFFIFI